MKECLFCQKEFEPAKPKQVFCTSKCRVYYSREEKSDGGFIYALRNPIDNRIFYVGKTIVSLNSRLKGHISEKKETSKNSIIKEILSNNQEVIIEELEFISEVDFKQTEQKLKDREVFWIKEFSETEPITNIQHKKEEAKFDFLRQWLLTHTCLHLAPLCRDVNVDKGNFHKWLKFNHPLSTEIKEKLIVILSNYGFELPKEEILVAKTVEQPIKKETILISRKENPQIPVREDGEDQFDFAARKNLWKQSLLGFK